MVVATLPGILHKLFRGWVDRALKSADADVSRFMRVYFLRRNSFFFLFAPAHGLSPGKTSMAIYIKKPQKTKPREFLYSYQRVTKTTLPPPSIWWKRTEFTSLLLLLHPLLRIRTMHAQTHTAWFPLLEAILRPWIFGSEGTVAGFVFGAFSRL